MVDYKHTYLWLRKEWVAKIQPIFSPVLHISPIFDKITQPSHLLQQTSTRTRLSEFHEPGIYIPLCVHLWHWGTNKLSFGSFSFCGTWYCKNTWLWCRKEWVVKSANFLANIACIPHIWQNHSTFSPYPCKPGIYIPLWYSYGTYEILRSMNHLLVH